MKKIFENQIEKYKWEKTKKLKEADKLLIEINMLDLFITDLQILQDKIEKLGQTTTEEQ